MAAERRRGRAEVLEREREIGRLKKKVEESETAAKERAMASIQLSVKVTTQGQRQQVQEEVIMFRGSVDRLQ